MVAERVPDEDAAGAGAAAGLVAGALEVATGLSEREETLLRALDDATRALDMYDQALADLRARERAARQEHYDLGGPLLPLGEKSAAQSTLEGLRREAKRTMQACLDALACGAMTRRSQVERLCASAGGLANRMRAVDQAVGQADVYAALANISDQKARQAFLLRYKHGLRDEMIAEEVHCHPKRVGGLIERAFGEIDRALNEPVVAEVRRKYYNVCLALGLEFPDYERLRGR